MYQIYCDDFPLYDPDFADLKLLSAKCTLEANTVCGGTLIISPTNPNISVIQPLKSVFKIKQGNHTLFKGRMTNNDRDFHKSLTVDLEGVLACANDTIIPPFNLLGNTIEWETFTETYTGDNIVAFFLGWILDRHNENVEDWQKLNLGTVTVTDPNNTLVRSMDDYAHTWEVLKTRLFESTLGGYLYVRYEDDGNYVDYVDEFEFTNTQRITVGKNILDIETNSNAESTYSAILPRGAEVTVEDGNDYEGEFVEIKGTTTERLTLETKEGGVTLADGDLTDDLVKRGKYIYSKSAVAQFGWICVPLSESENKDITKVENLKEWAMEYLAGKASKFSNTIKIKAIDLRFSDEEIASIRAYRNIIVDAPTHGIDGVLYPLAKLAIDLLNPQNTVIDMGETVRSFVSINRQQATANQVQIKEVKHEVQIVKENIVETVKEQSRTQSTELIQETNAIILSALEAYVETSNLEEYKETVSAQLSVLADNIAMEFNTVTERFNRVDGDLQAEITERTKYITFSEDGITIGAGENAMQIQIDNDMISFKKNGVQFGLWDGVNFQTGNIVVNVNERAQFGNFAFVPRSDGSIMFLKVGG